MIMLLLAVLLASPARAAETLFRSGPASAHLIELYSSEGCSSCPPADEWLAALRKSGGLWSAFVPVAFHVTYWDHLGWKDPYASPGNTERQRAYAAAWGSRSVYTPGFVLDGGEWRDWSDGPPRAGGAAGVLTVRAGGKTLRASFAPAAPGGPYEVYAARLGFGLESRVAAGENAGRALRHEFVSRGLTRAAMKEKNGVWSAAFPPPPEAGGALVGLAVWVVGADGRPAQATGGFLP